MKITMILKLFTITTLIAAATVFISACGDSDDEDASPADHPTATEDHDLDALRIPAR